MAPSPRVRDQVRPGAGAPSKAAGSSTGAPTSSTSPWHAAQFAARGVPIRMDSRVSLPSASSRSGRMSSRAPLTWHWTQVAAARGALWSVWAAM